MKKAVIIIAAIIAAVLLIGGILSAALYYWGRWGDYHPQKQAKPGQVKIACVGDSITYGFKVTNWRKNNYPAQLGAALGEGFCVNNFGYCGRTVQSTSDLPYTAEELYRQSMDFEPDIVVIMLGTNDAWVGNWNRENFIKDYRALVESYIRLPNRPSVYVMTPPPLFAEDSKQMYRVENDTIFNEIVPLIKQTAKSMNVPCIDIYAVFEGKPELFGDGCHPKVAGAKIIAETVGQRISEDLASMRQY